MNKLIKKINCTECNKELIVSKFHLNVDLCNNCKKIKKRILSNCENCNKEHYSEFATGRFCSRSCANSFSAKNDNSNETKIINCISCNKEIEVNKRSPNKAKCKECRILSRTIIKTCKYCKKEFKTLNKSQKFCGHDCSNKMPITEETRNKMKLNHKGNWPGAGRGKSGTYKGYYCDSTWELAFTVYNIEHNIKFLRNNKGFDYIFENKKHKYYPDYIINGEFVEIKGVDNDLWQAKLKHFPYKIKVLYKKEMKKYFDYIIGKYGNNYIYLYDEKIKYENICKVCGKITYNHKEFKELSGCCRAHTTKLRKFKLMNDGNKNYRILLKYVDEKLKAGYKFGRIGKVNQY